MDNIINFANYKAEQELKRKKEELIAKINTNITTFEVNYTFLELLDLFCQKYHPEFYWEFDLFINGKLK